MEMGHSEQNVLMHQGSYVHDDEAQEDILEEENISNEEIHISRINMTPLSTPTSGSNKKARYDSDDAIVIASFDKWMEKIDALKVIVIEDNSDIH